MVARERESDLMSIRWIASEQGMKMNADRRQGLSFAALDQRLRDVPDGPAGALNTRKQGSESNSRSGPFCFRGSRWTHVGGDPLDHRHERPVLQDYLQISVVMKL